MPRTKSKTRSTAPTRTNNSLTQSNQSFLNRVQLDLENKNALLNLVLGVLIIIVGGILVFNYFNKNKTNLGPAQQTETPSVTTPTADVNKDSLPGSYTVKEGDTLFTIAQKYYDDGYQYPQIASANKLSNDNDIVVGQSLTIPKLATASNTAQTSSPNPNPTTAPAVGGAINQTTWGTRIETDTYTVVSGDWLSTIAGRAYGDIYAFDRIAKANNIPNPNLIEPGMVLKIPR